ncbi:MAG: HAMP domain-containing histidine kinase [Gemmatimonadetes bacterium]|nr:HAMP domain-containing histidine kinase [Gemmatimonadota bacterium]
MTREPVVGPVSRIPAWLDRSGAAAVRLLALAVLAWLLAELVVKLTLVVVAVLVALLLAGVFAPVVRWAAARGAPRWISAGLVILLLLGLIAGAGAAIGARVSSQLPELRDQLQTASNTLSSTLGVDVPVLGSSSGNGPSFDVLSSARVVADVLVGSFLALALAFLFLHDGRSMWQWLLGKLGGRVREDVDAAGRAAWDTIGAYVRGLTVVALFDAIGIGVGLLLLGVPAAVPDGARDHVDRIRGAALHLTHLIEEVLTHARIEAGRDELHIATTELPVLIADVVGMVEPLARQKGLRFEVDVAHTPDLIDTDPQKLRQILLNLLGNAVKFTERGKIGLAGRTDEEHLVLEVSDTGIGIAAGFLDKIFEPFWQVDGTKTRRAGGTGLGLGVVRQLARRLGGEVGVRSVEGEGSVFTIRIPRQSHPAAEASD